MDPSHHNQHQKIDDPYALQAQHPTSSNSTPTLQEHSQHGFVKQEPNDITFIPGQGSYAQFKPSYIQQPLHHDPHNHPQHQMYQVDYSGQPQSQTQAISHYHMAPAAGAGQYYQPQVVLQHDQTQPIAAPPHPQRHLNAVTQSFPPVSSGVVSHTPPLVAAQQLNRRKRSRKTDQFIPGDNGDTELKQLAVKASTVPLSQLALRIKQLENEYSNSSAAEGAPEVDSSDSHKFKEHKERQRQLFGMVWLINSCESSPTAVVPRNRIYARYVQICADNSLAPLSPANFGKLVRILFPNLTTRRLGMRGQSKYHYCGVKLIGDQNLQSLQHQQQHSHSRSQHHVSGLGISNFASSHQIQSPISSTNSSISLDDSPITTSQIHTPSYTPINSPAIANSNSISDQLPSVSHLKYVPNLDEMLNSNLGQNSNPNVSLELPSIYPYLQRDIDYDIADTLYSLYKVHVNALFESLRYMQLKSLFASFNNFNSTLTAPVFKLYTHESIIEWVKQCDLVMYKRMIRMLSKLQLQFSIPPEVLSQLKQVSSGYVKTLSSNLVNNKVTKNFFIMKLKLAKNFVNFLNRLIKIIETGQSAARILNDPLEKKAMVHDWMRLDIQEIVFREIPCGEKNIEVLLYILNNDLLNMLTSNDSSNSSDSSESDGNEIMIQISNCISELPGKFTNINPRLFILLTSNLLTTCLREISLASGQGFGAWWIVRCWIDEYLSWRFELGGLFQDDFGADTQNTGKELAESMNEGHRGETSTGRNTNLDIEAANVSANTSLNISGTNFDLTSNLSNNSDINQDSNVGNTSMGAVDLLGASYRFDRGGQHTTSATSSNQVHNNAEDILLNYESNDNFQ